jgi:hypothetical protein
MYYNLDLDKVRVRGDKVGRVVSSHLKEKYGKMIVNVHCHVLSYHWKGVHEFSFTINVDYGRQDGPDSFYNRIIKKEVSNLCKYILGKHESFGCIVFNSVIHGAV